ncbi:MAG: amino acid adenylation domain-containing protein, partial [Gemmatimonadaceae bacterium]
AAFDGSGDGDGIIGMFINTLPVRVRIPPDQNTTEWLQQLRREQFNVRNYEHTPLATIQSASALPSGAALFDTFLVFDHREQMRALDALDPRCAGFRLQEQTTFPISLHAFGEDELLLQLQYYRSRFDDRAIARMLGHLLVLLQEMVTKSDQPTSALQFVDAKEQRALVNDLNNTTNALADVIPSTPNAIDQTLHALLNLQASRTPEAIAVQIGDKTLTHAELDARATTLAFALRDRGVKANVLVGICMERSLEMVVSLVAVLKAGGAYVPMDPEYPADRLSFMLNDAQCPVLLTQRRLLERSLADLAPEVASTRLCVDDSWPSLNEAHGAGRDTTLAESSPDDLAYMIYTSGSTGRPKGAMNRHRGIVNRLLWMQREYQLTSQDAVLQKTPFSFDVSVWEFFWPLLTGARLVLAKPGGHRDPEYLKDLISETQITVCHFVPSMLRAFLDGVGPQPQPTLLRDVMCSGEALSNELQERFFRRFPDVRLHNLYGPTEAAVDVTFWQCDKKSPRKIVPIGKPVDNTTMYVLDPHMQPVPIGVPGELFIGGVQVGAGYHNRPELTAERFLVDPFASDTSRRMYRTGDRARWLEDGTLEYLGRLDFQVKLRGFRIEIGEIESTIAEDAAMCENVVVLREDPGIDPRLVAYYVIAPNVTVSHEDLASRLSARLPAHMVPSVFVSLPAMPLSPSGKLDRKALPAPDTQVRIAAFVTPRDDVEMRVLRIWHEVLGASRISVADRFNDVGGNSLAALRVFGRLKAEFSREIPLVEMLRHDTVEKLADLLRDGSRVDSWQCVVPFATTGKGPPVFLPHAQTGYVLVYQHLAQALGDTFPVYGLQALGNFGNQEPMESIPQLVEYYLAEILKLYPTGPLILFGVSFGGWLALELSRELQGLGRSVILTGMYDTEAPGHPRYSRYGRIVRTVKDRGGVSFAKLRKLFVVPMPRLLAPKTFYKSAGALYRNFRSTGDWWWNLHMRRIRLERKFRTTNPPHDLALPTNLTRFRIASHRIAAQFAPAPYHEPVLYVRAQQRDFGVTPDNTRGWGPVLSDMTIVEVPGGHLDGMFPPHVADVARILRERIEAQSTVGA